eukprot:1178238-Amphidinium_carterae.4
MVNSASGLLLSAAACGISGLSACVVAVASKVAGGAAVCADSWEVATMVGGGAPTTGGEVARRVGEGVHS